MSAEISVVFEELFYGSGAWLGLLLLLAIITGLMARSKEISVLMIPVTLFLAIDYFGREMLIWNGIIMLCTTVFIVMANMKGK